MEEKDLIKELSLPLFQSKGWMKLLGVVMIIQGIIMVFTIVGIIFCWLPIWLGLLLFKASTFIETAQYNGDKAQFLMSMQRIKTYFVINGVLMLIGLVGAAIALIISGGAMFSMMNNF